MVSINVAQRELVRTETDYTVVSARYEVHPGTSKMLALEYFHHLPYTSFARNLL